MTTTRYEMDLPVQLAPNEIREKAEELAGDAILAAEIQQLIEEQTVEHKQNLKKAKEHLHSVRSRMEENANAIVSGEEIRGVMVEDQVAEDNSRIVIYRLDTNEIVNERPLTEEDRQMQIDEAMEEKTDT